ncbi:MAG: hypothetical protein OXF50_22845 [Caldilineaceae bacterium]|nr:hypothetical protein [Caldilineaceae bacterium]
MRLFIDVTIAQATLFARRPAFVIYAVLMLVLTGAVIFTDNLSGGSGALVVRVSNNILFFQLPLLALLISPLVVQNKGPRKDWLWTTPLELPLLVLSQFVSVAVVLCITLALTGFFALAFLTIAGMIPTGNVVSLYGYYLLLILPVTLAAAGAVIALALLARNTYVVTAAVAGVSALTWLGLFMPTATLLTPLNFTLLTLDLNPVAGLGAERPLLLSFLLFYLGCIPLMLILAMAGHTRLDRRSGWSPKWRRGFAGLALLAVVAAGGTWQYFSVNAAQRLVPPPAAEQVDVWEVVNVEQSVILNGRILVASTKMSLKNMTGAAHDSVELSLNSGLLVTDATVDGEPVFSQRAGELIRLESLPSPVPANDGIVLELRYTGIPVLLREDYTPATSISGNNPASFRKEAVSFVNERTLQWMRDSDWFAWPLSSGPHVAGNAHKLRISFNNWDGPVLTSGAVIAQDSGVDIYTWDKPPQFLLARGVYRHDSSAEGDTWVGKLSTGQTTTTARKLLRLRRALGEWLEPSPPAAYQAVELPYVQGIAMGGSLLGFPNEIESSFSHSSTSVTVSDSSSGAPPEVKTVHTPAAASFLNLAVEVSRPWLSDEILWPRNELTRSGNLRSYSVTCDPPDDTGNQECVRESLGGVNPQAPDGRWSEESESKSDVAPLLQAFAVVVAHELVLTVAGEQAFVKEELSKWNGIILLYLEGQGNTNSLISPYLAPEQLPVGTWTDRHNCQLAHFVVALSEFKSQLGRDALAGLIAALAQTHPPGGDPITEEAVRRILQDSFGYESPPSEMACTPGEARTPAR